MKYFKNPNLILVLLLLIAAPAIAQKSFEGKIVYSIELTGEGADQMAAFLPQNYEFLVKGQKLKFKMNGGMTAAMMGEFIVDGKAEKSWMLKHDEKTAYIMPYGVEEEDNANTEIIKENETQVISGYECSKYKVISNTPNGETMTQYFWVTDKFNFDTLKNAKGMGSGGIFQGGIDGIPLKIQSENMGMTMIITATTFDNKDVSDSEFEFPDTYEQKEFDYANFPGGGGE